VVIVRTACKRKATEYAGVHPLKLIRESIGQVDLEEVGDIRDVACQQLNVQETVEALIKSYAFVMFTTLTIVYVHCVELINLN